MISNGRRSGDGRAKQWWRVARRCSIPSISMADWRCHAAKRQRSGVESRLAATPSSSRSAGGAVLVVQGSPISLPGEEDGRMTDEKMVENKRCSAAVSDLCQQIRLALFLPDRPELGPTRSVRVFCPRSTEYYETRRDLGSLRQQIWSRKRRPGRLLLPDSLYISDNNLARRPPTLGRSCMAGIG